MFFIYYSGGFMKTFLRILYFIFLTAQICFTQYSELEKTDINNIPFPHKHKLTPHIPKESSTSMHPSFYDRKDEWPLIIKQFWGQGESLSGKLATFDLYQNFARAWNATFLWNPTNWDSLAALLRSRITESTSRGEFSRILNDLAWGISDGHAYAMDSIMLSTPLNPGTPILVDGGGFINHFGAGLTPLEDSSLLVYKVVPNHPLGLVPGDIILGYQGIPWHQIVRELLAGGVPHALWIGAAPSSINRVLLWAAGESWHMFDTIDVKKYGSGEIIHLPLDTMITLNVTDVVVNNEQLPVPGVPMPIFSWNSGAVKYGIIQGTNTGYIYVYNHGYAAVSDEFDEAVQALMGTDGLIIDLRLDWGGAYGLNKGISRLMNHSTHTLDMMSRCSAGDLFSICPNATWFIGDIPGDLNTYYDKPIAVLLGPGCVSYGDISSWQLSYVQNARMFGRSPMAAYSGMVLYNQPSRYGYALQCPDVTFTDHYNPEIIRWGQEYPLFEEVWLTPDGVANGEDGVVTRALEWMNNLVYAHNVLTDKDYYIPQSTVNIFTTVENPNANNVTARGYLKTLGGVTIDSINLVKQSFNNTGDQWVGNVSLPDSENFYAISITAFDNSAGSQFETPGAKRLTTAGPLVVDCIMYVHLPAQKRYSFRPYLHNTGSTLPIGDIIMEITCNDPWVTNFTNTNVTFPTIQPGGILQSSTTSAIYYDSTFPGYFNFKFEIMSDGWCYWKDSTQLLVTGIKSEEIFPTEFALSQNYPNPFNSSSVIKYSIPKSSQVSLKIFNTLGQEIETLVNEEKPVGTYEVNWNAANLPSGVYFYRLKVGDFVETKKMILLK